MHSAPDGFERWKTISRPAADGSTEDEQLAVLGREVSGWLNGADRKNLELYDAVLIDEGQDIAPSCVLALQQVLPAHSQLAVGQHREDVVAVVGVVVLAQRGLGIGTGLAQ